MQMCKFSGCSLGLVSKSGLPIRKPWTVATTCRQLREELGKHECPGSEAHPVHQPCAGQETKSTEGYTDSMARLIHEAFRQSCSHSLSKKLSASPACCAPSVGPSINAGRPAPFRAMASSPSSSSQGPAQRPKVMVAAAAVPYSQWDDPKLREKLSKDDDR